jgi:chromosome segregation ATPase
MTDRWEEAFDSWRPEPGAGDETDPDFEPDREELLRLARALAEQRRAEQDAARTELETLKESLRERATAVAERERELLELQQSYEKKQGKKATSAAPAVDTDAIAARERAALERLQAVEARERELEARAAELEAEAAEVSQREEELHAELEAVSEREAARLAEARRAQEELADLRRELDRQRLEIEERERAVATAQVGDTQPEVEAELVDDRERELRRLETRLDARERELALLRQGLDAQRIELSDRERRLRRRELAEVRQSYDPPLAPPSFSDGLAAFVSERGRR